MTVKWVWDCPGCGSTNRDKHGNKRLICSHCLCSFEPRQVVTAIAPPPRDRKPILEYYPLTRRWDEDEERWIDL